MRLWRGILAGTLALCLAVPVCAAPVEDTVAQQRQEDLDFLYDTLKRGHPGPVCQHAGRGVPGSEGGDREVAGFGQRPDLCAGSAKPGCYGGRFPHYDSSGQPGPDHALLSHSPHLEGWEVVSDYSPRCREGYAGAAGHRG